MELFIGKDIHVNIRWMVRHDFEAVVAIEQESFEFPWNADEFLHCLQSRNCIGMVAEYEGEIAGYVIYETPKQKIFLTNIAVAAKYRRKGVARQIIQKLISKMIYQNRRKLLVEIRETNLSALKCFRALGFLAAATLENYYTVSGTGTESECAYLLQYQPFNGSRTKNIITRNRCTKLK